MMSFVRTLTTVHPPFYEQSYTCSCLQYIQLRFYVAFGSTSHFILSLIRKEKEKDGIGCIALPSFFRKLNIARKLSSILKRFNNHSLSECAFKKRHDYRG